MEAAPTPRPHSSNPDRAAYFRFALDSDAQRRSARAVATWARMLRTIARVPQVGVAIIGCDIRDARPADVLATFRPLGHADAVFGPAEDGGHRLVGFSPRRPSRPFAAVRWSTATP
jgi:glycosyltransferase A (GT-A) superfamily protein (DUF2064 family)